ncbi:hypothetical protein GCM10011351_09200 [Paraliobacillus quinghaiensis]|uniref:Branched-chain amino acid transporter n=1 Tax=Paraliobacillus quinghaiensis TaxID=470815 RepID=A0A917WSR5_9BACI|nr:AzlD domain-containing protein [Paraliobacillus quinghaiensis]GGM25650.1 hypothetical protein GCM10011351_09200 [Paraliobacillus quinghaiensis]
MIMFTIIGMAVVTVIPRLIPAFIMDKVNFPNWVNRWLNVIPYAALGALIFPGILTVIPEQPWIGFVGGLVAIGLAVFRVNIIVVVIGAAATVFILN